MHGCCQSCLGPPLCLERGGSVLSHKQTLRTSPCLWLCLTAQKPLLLAPQDRSEMHLGPYGQPHTSSVPVLITPWQP